MAEASHRGKLLSLTSRLLNVCCHSSQVEDKQRLMFVTTTEDGLQATGVIMLALGGMTSPHLGQYARFALTALMFMVRRD